MRYIPTQPMIPNILRNVYDNGVFEIEEIHVSNLYAKYSCNRMMSIIVSTYNSLLKSHKIAFTGIHQLFL